MSACKRCGTEGVLFGHLALCADCYRKHRAHQASLREEAIRNRELLAARLVHPAGKHRHRARDWIQKLDPESGRSTA